MRSGDPDSMALAGVIESRPYIEALEVLTTLCAQAARPANESVEMALNVRFRVAAEVAGFRRRGRSSHSPSRDETAYGQFRSLGAWRRPSIQGRLRSSPGAEASRAATAKRFRKRRQVPIINTISRL
jgi:hypothetical protein